MAITIVETPGATNANSFVSAAMMSAFCDARLNASIWTGADAQLPALVMATQELTLLDYIGTRVTATQALSWPREFAINPDAPSLQALGDVALLYFANTVVPQRIKDATCLLALEYLKAGTTDLSVADPNAGVIEKTVDVLTTRWASAAERPTGWRRFPMVGRLLDGLLASGNTLELVRA